MMKTRKWFRVVTAGLIVASSWMIMSCDLDDEDNYIPQQPVSYVSLYNASPDAPELNIIVDNRTINNRPFEYTDNTGYLRFYTGKRNIQFGPFGASNVTVDTAFTLVPDKAYSIFVVNNYENAEALLLTDTSAAEPAAGKAMLRFVNLSPDSDPLLLKVKDQAALTEAKAFKGATAFFEVDAKAYAFEITSPDGTTTKLNIPNVTIEPKSYHTILVRGYKTPPAGNSSVLSGEVIEH